MSSTFEIPRPSKTPKTVDRHTGDRRSVKKIAEEQQFVLGHLDVIRGIAGEFVERTEMSLDDLVNIGVVRLYEIFPQIKRNITQEDLREYIAKHVRLSIEESLVADARALGSEQDADELYSSIPRGMYDTTLVDGYVPSPRDEAAFARLSPRERHIIRAVVRDEETLNEVGNFLGISHQGVGHARTNALQKMKDFLEKDAEDRQRCREEAVRITLLKSITQKREHNEAIRKAYTDIFFYIFHKQPERDQDLEAMFDAVVADLRPPYLRNIIQKYYFEYSRFTDAQIAKKMGISIKKMRTWRNDALEKIGKNVRKVSEK